MAKQKLPTSLVSLETMQRLINEYISAKSTIQWLKDNDQLILKPGDTVDELARNCAAPLKIQRAALDQLIDESSEMG